VKRQTEAPPRIYIGIDFSGSAEQWKAGKRNSNVWIATAAADGERRLVLKRLVRVQELPGTGDPFTRLTGFLQSAPFAAAAIDAPFSVPREYVPEGRHALLLDQVAALRAAGRPFARGQDIVDCLLPEDAPRNRKYWRCTEEEWRKRVNVRSTLWNGPRGGAAFTAACLTLLHRAGIPVWPWAGPEAKCLAEAFPAAQLSWWGLSCEGYSDPKEDAACVRAEILKGLKRQGLRFTKGLESKMLESADALDAAVCVFAAKAVRESRLVSPPEADWETEGWIAVHR
jgi:hypothetical protein